MAFAQVKFFQTWKIAAFSVAFFSSFFSYSLDYSSLDGVAPESESCFIWSHSVSIHGSPVLKGSCNSPASSAIAESLVYSVHPGFYDCSLSSSTQPYPTLSYFSFSCLHDPNEQNIGSLIGETVKATLINGVIIRQCLSLYDIGIDNNFDDEIDFCYKSEDIQNLINKKNQLDKNDDYCKGLSMDSGNNTSDTVCYSAPNGSQCSMSKQSGDNYTYYSGTGTETLGCGSSENPPYDSSGTGSEKDDCIFSNGTNFCKANEDKHCKTIDGIKICDSGCIDSENGLFCDASQHEDVGEGESDYFSDNGTCSVVHASSSKGACEDFGGVWDENGADWIETSCPTGSGTCSTGSSFCGSCMDEGGIWTPDPINIQTERDGINDVAVRIEKSNEKLSAIEMTTRKTNEALISATKSGDGKLLAAIEELTKLTKDNNKFLGVKSEEKEEKETFTTITNDTDNSAITALFNDASKLALEAEIDQLKLDTTAFINNARVEATSLMTITIPNSVGYEVRNLTLTAGTFDVSLSRFSSFFILLSGPIMLLCSIISGFILLGGKD